MKTYKNIPKSEWERLCSRPALTKDDLQAFCAEVFAKVQKDGDKAVIGYEKQFSQVNIKSIIVNEETLRAQASKVSTELKKAIDIAYQNIQKFHSQQKEPIQKIQTMPGVVCWREARAIEKVGLYIPDGTAPLVSTALMLGVPAQIAGCGQIVLTTPANSDGTINPAICYAALKIGASQVICAGGAQAIAALTIGTKSIPKVDKIFGPGNQYVTAAKQYAVNYGVAIDMPAGPSEVMVIADETADPAFVAADLLSQAEHGTDSQVVLLTTSSAMLSKVKTEISKQLKQLPRNEIAAETLVNSFCMQLSSLSDCMEFANMYAPEHLILSVKNSGKVAATVVNAGSVFLGNYSPESAGDYASGTNHTLPTAGWAKSYGGVSLDSFVKKITFQVISEAGLQKLGPTIELLANAEGLQAHARAVSIRTPGQNNVQ